MRHHSDREHYPVNAPRGLGETKLHLVDDVETAGELMRWLSTKNRIAVDTECTGLNTLTDYVRLVQVGDMHEGWTIPWHRWGGVFEEIVKKFTGDYVLHNMTYDWAMLSNSCGIDLPRHKCHDTRVAAHVLHPDRSTGLKNLASFYVDPHAAALGKQLDDILGNRGGWTWETIPVDYGPYWQYAALDTVLTAHLDDILMPRVMEQAPLAYKLECAAMWVTRGMQQRGAMIDREYTETKYSDFMRYVDQMDTWCKAEYGVRPSQDLSVIERLQADGVVFTKMTDGGRYSLDKEVLMSLAGQHPLADAVLNRRRIQKIASTYLKNFLTLSDGNDLLHPNINTLGFHEAKDFGVITGRMSMSEPNLQNLSRQAAEGTPANVVRRCIVSRPGNTLLMCDFDQIEARIIAHLTQDPGFINAFSQGDFFTNITRMLWNDDTIEKKDDRRQSSKNAIYARAYGAGAPKFAKTAGIPEDVAVAMYRRLDQLFPGWQATIYNIEATARMRLETEGVAYVQSPLTRRRHVADERKIYVLMNYLIQGTAAEVFKMKLVQLAEAGLDEFMILPVHDEIIQDVPDDMLLEVAHKTRTIMNDATMFSVPLTASPATGRRWGEKQDLKL